MISFRMCSNVEKYFKFKLFFYRNGPFINVPKAKPSNTEYSNGMPEAFFRIWNWEEMTKSFKGLDTSAGPEMGSEGSGGAKDSSAGIGSENDSGVRGQDTSNCVDLGEEIDTETRNWHGKTIKVKIVITIFLFWNRNGSISIGPKCSTTQDFGRNDRIWMWKQ